VKVPQAGDDLYRDLVAGPSEPILTGSYAAGPERWGWRTELHLGDDLLVRSINISPAGEESPGIEARWTRLSRR